VGDRARTRRGEGRIRQTGRQTDRRMSAAALIAASQGGQLFQVEALLDQGVNVAHELDPV